MAQHSHPPRRVAQSPKQNTFFGGAAVLAAGILVVKLIGLFYKIPLLNIIGEQGTADFGNAYNIYAVLLTISTAGLPVAVSKLVSEANALGRQNQVRRTFRLAMALFLTLGVLSFRVRDRDCEELGEALGRRGIALRAGLHCAPLAHRTAGTLESGTLRASVSAFTVPEEIGRVLATMEELLREEAV